MDTDPSPIAASQSPTSALSPAPAGEVWRPVPRQCRADGWTPRAQRAFIETLADSGSVTQAARVVGMSPTSCYRLRRAPGAEEFSAAWAAAIDEASKRLVDAAFERAIVGSDEPVFDRDGNRIGSRFRQSDRMLMFLLRAYMPERFRHAAQETRRPDESPVPALAQVAGALALLGPELSETPRPRSPDPMPMGEDFERDLEDAKRDAAELPPLTNAEWTAHRNMLLG